MTDSAKQLVKELKDLGPAYSVRALNTGSDTAIVFINPNAPCIGTPKSFYTEADLKEAIESEVLAAIKCPACGKHSTYVINSLKIP
jgi:hypothetical protein